MARRRWGAAAALLLLGASFVLAVVVTITSFPRGLSVFLCVVAGIAVGWWGLLRGGWERAVGGIVAAVVLVGAVVLLLVEGHVLANLLVVAGVVFALAAAREVFALRVALPAAVRPARPVLFYNPKSGGGKAERFDVAGEARARGVQPIELRRGDDLAVIVRAAIAQGADALGMAGGDGSQAVVAGIAAEHGLPYVCVPAGTRNHFALDLGVDRDDVVGALDAFVSGGERVIDLAEVNDRVFVNNVSLGVYAEAVQKESYRGAKLRTLVDTMPAVLGPQGEGLDLHWIGPDGRRAQTNAVVLVSNDPYRLGRALGSGTRPRLDTGRLGVAVVGARGAGPGRVQQWTVSSFEVESGHSVAAGIDGEAVRLDPPLRFRSRPAALRVRIAPAHPGASPSAGIPEDAWQGIRVLARVAASGSG
jgi:diacylglycerol kinase family enzyme